VPKSYRVAVIAHTGKGDYGHGLDVVWRNITNVDVVAVADADDKGRALAAQRLKAKRSYADYRQMLAKERPQIVGVAVRWLDQHRDMVVACAEAGASMLLEKPFARTLAEADEMITACERHHVKLAIAHPTRYSPRSQRIRDLIADGRLGDLLEFRARGKEDSRGGGEDLMVLGTHLMDLMRLLGGDARWCYARVSQAGKLVTAAQVREGGEGMGLTAGDQVTAQYGFDKGVVGYFASHRAKHGAGARFGLQIYGSKGIIQLIAGSLPAAYFLEDTSWFPGRSKAQWQEITSAGVGKPEPLESSGQAQGNLWIAQDLIDAIEKDRQPLGSMYDGRAALEMIMAVYEAHRIKGPVELPLKSRRHPLTML
jgi:predicted dehydrogenase